MRTLVALCALATLTACTPAEPAADPAPRPTITTAPPTVDTTTTTTTDAPGTTPQPDCLAGDAPFQEEGAAGSNDVAESDAALIASFDWTVAEGCERLSLTLATPEGAPAVEPPPFSSFVLRDAGVVRIDLGDEMTGSSIAELAVETPLVDRVYVVRGLDGSIFVDLHLAAPAFARVSTASPPARLVVDLRPGGGSIGEALQRPGELVVVEPAGSATTYPVTVSGYLRTGATEVEGVLSSLSDGTNVVATGSAADQADLWGSFSLVFPNGPTGRVSISVAGLANLELRVR